MAFDTLTTARAPTYSMTVAEKANVFSANFGDGYKQRMSFGLNSVGKTVSLDWTVLDFVDADAIISFLETKKGITPFLYTLPFDSSPVLWTCEEWSWTYDSVQTKAVRATFVEAFDPQ